MSSLESAIYGTTASLIANTIVYPLDLVKTVIQTQLELSKTPSDSPRKAELKQRYKNSLDALIKIYKAQGVKGWYKGLSSSLAGTAVQSFTYFYWYSWIHKIWRKLKVLKKFTLQNSTAEELILGMIAAALGQLFTNPINVISTRQQTNPEKNKSVKKAVQGVFKEDGITGFWRGLKVSLVLTINPSITYASFERLKRMFFADRGVLMPYESFTLGVLSKMLATIITQPLIISKAMLQKNEDSTEEMKTFQGVLKYLVKNEGVKGLWKGVMPQLTKGILVQGFIFMFKDQLVLLFKALVLTSKLRQKQLAK